MTPKCDKPSECSKIGYGSEEICPDWLQLMVYVAKLIASTDQRKNSRPQKDEHQRSNEECDQFPASKSAAGGEHPSDSPGGAP